MKMAEFMSVSERKVYKIRRYFRDIDFGITYVQINKIMKLINTLENLASGISFRQLQRELLQHKRLNWSAKYTIGNYRD